MKIRLTKLCALFVAATLFALAVYQWRNPQPSAPLAKLVPPAPEATETNQIVPPARAQPTVTPVVVENDSFQRQPFRAAIERGAHGWTAEDGRDTNVISQLAHNNLEYARMVDENSRIQRRQLVYRTEPAAAVIQRAKLSNTPVTRLALPGLDGREIDFEVQQSDLNPSGQQGMFTGRVAGQPDSMVTLAFKGGREAFTVLAPAENLFLQADPREPGEIIVKQIDPATYVPGICGTP